MICFLPWIAAQQIEKSWTQFFVSAVVPDCSALARRFHIEKS